MCVKQNVYNVQKENGKENHYLLRKRRNGNKRESLEGEAKPGQCSEESIGVHSVGR